MFRNCFSNGKNGKEFGKEFVRRACHKGSPRKATLQQFNCWRQFFLIIKVVVSGPKTSREEKKENRC